jgi:arylformamidase
VGIAVAHFFDLTQPIRNRMPIYPGDPEPRLQPAAGLTDPWQVSELHLGTHTGTHIDAPAHFFPTGKTIDQYSPARFVLPGMVTPRFSLADDQPMFWEASSLSPGSAVLIQTGWDRFWGTERYFSHPFLSLKLAQSLVDAGVKLVGIDAPNVDSTVQGTSHAHEILLGNDVLIVENLKGLAQLTPHVLYQCSFLPLLLYGLDGSPVRAVAWENE